MHSRIFQLEYNKDNLENVLCEENFNYDGSCEWFINSIADYVSDETDKEKDIKWFTDVLNDKCNNLFKIKYDNISKEIEFITFLKGFKHSYFKEKYEQFKEMTNGLTIEDFANRFKSYKLSNSLEDKFNIYVYNHEDGLQTLDSFIRGLNNDEDETYYFGSTIDYHF